MSTIREVAQRARVSVGTVSNILSDAVPVSPDLRARVERVMRELDYHPNHAARSLKSRRTQTLGVVISDLTNPFFPLVIRGAEDAALKRGFLLNIFNTDDNVEREQKVFSILRMRRVDGILAVVAPNPDEPRHILQILNAKVPVVCMDRAPAKLQVDSVLVDNTAGALTCVRHLTSRGHVEIAMITGPANLQTSRERVEGYRMALSEAGITPRREFLQTADFRFENGYRLAKALCLGNPRPTAIFAANGTMGLGAVKAISEIGIRCPEDIAIAVFDDVPGADVLRPRLTVVSQPAYHIGYKAAELLMQRINNEIASSEPITIKLNSELHIRESTSLSR